MWFLAVNYPSFPCKQKILWRVLQCKWFVTQTSYKGIQSISRKSVIPGLAVTLKLKMSAAQKLISGGMRRRKGVLTGGTGLAVRKWRKLVERRLCCCRSSSRCSSSGSKQQQAAGTCRTGQRALNLTSGREWAGTLSFADVWRGRISVDGDVFLSTRCFWAPTRFSCWISLND